MAYKGGLRKWFKEDWRDVSTGKKCGRKSSSKSKESIQRVARWRQQQNVKRTESFSRPPKTKSRKSRRKAYLYSMVRFTLWT